MVAEPWARPAGDVVGDLEASPDSGLSGEEAGRRLDEVGPNALREHEVRGPVEIFVDQFKSVIVLLLGLAAGLSFLFGSFVEGWAIVAVLLINAGIGFVAEMRAMSSMESLRKLGTVHTRVRRDGSIQRISAEELVPGDVVVLESGDVVTADVRLVESSGLEANESALTGESVPVEKGVEPVSGEAPLAERSSMLFKGTAVTRGNGVGVVVATGMGTELGHISSLVEAAAKEKTPLEVRLDLLGRKLVWVVLVLAVLIVAAGVSVGRDLFLIVETAIALAVAAIPEGLPIVATLALARGMWRMAKSNAVVNRLSAVETLGSTNVILTDKTGTLTENEMAVTRVALHRGDVVVGDGGFVFQDGEIDPAENRALRRVLMTGVLCNTASLDGGGGGEPTERALLKAGRLAGYERSDLLNDMPKVREDPFDPESKVMATFHEWGNNFLVAVKGAPESVLEVCSRVDTGDDVVELSGEERKEWLERNEEMAEDGLRMLAVAYREVGGRDAEPYEDLVLVGLTGLLDPPRRDVRDSILAAKDAGIRVVMVTGDQAGTARNIAMAVGLAEEGEEVMLGKELDDVENLSPEERRRLIGANIFARTSPEQKLKLMALHQEGGEVVAMIGDGVNDAPSLKKADIGVAMGQRGTQVAQEASDMVLRDDRFGTIVQAIEQGRAIFNNIRKFVLYLLSCNVSEIMVVSVATLASAPLPILPLQILFLNLITDVFPALALGVGEGGPRIMEKPPREPGEPVLTRRHWWEIGGYGVLITASVLTAFGLALGYFAMGTARAVTISFLVLAFAQLFHVFNMAGGESGALVNEVTRNAWVWGAVALSAGLLLLGIYLPGLSDVLGVVNPGRTGWMLILGLSVTPLVTGRILSVLGGLRGATS